ncbi:CEP2 [Symbiodinium natans]|uniref:CEP2 protein n=1 Tax=Symbiodinium natans TaxID=878477 RepID=A0A812QJH5_9DINO|nr:CEP2 [Symbiodinium natans]
MKTLTGYQPTTRAPAHKALGFLHVQTMPQNLALPQDVDWRQHTPASNFVRTQGTCGSCWAIASANALEMHAELNGLGHEGVDYQDLVSCTPNLQHCGGDGGCSGATAELAFQYAKDVGVRLYAEDAGAMGAWVGSASEACGSHPGARITTEGFVRVTPNLAQPLLQAIAMQGPVVVSVDATSWDTYGSGIFDGCSKDARVNHAVVAVGYGQSPKGKYFLIRNSWGPGWGEEGHIRVLRFEDGPGPSGAYCGTDYHPEEGVACQGETQPVRVCGMCGILMDSSYPVGVRVSSSAGKGSTAQKM